MRSEYLFSSMRLEGGDGRFQIKPHYGALRETRKVMREYCRSNFLPGMETLATTLKVRERSRRRQTFPTLTDWVAYTTLLRLRPRTGDGQPGALDWHAFPSASQHLVAHFTHLSASPPASSRGSHSEGQQARGKRWLERFTSSGSVRKTSL